ncbi:hypothetical protein [Desulfonatronum thiosulfatophilum]|uniref:hypothetical protein n=1 Tax=Desulfonatronum thiosulfatophilum TaxID=617002 RepID=UPI001FC9DA00|nr:hypothetical protein [Desulfonatronum thiosulfatophilum]
MKMMIQVQCLDQRQVEHGVATIAASLLACYALGIFFLNCVENFVNALQELFIFLKKGGKIWRHVVLLKRQKEENPPFGAGKKE